MANAFLKPEQIVAQMVGVLARDTVLAQFVWRELNADRFKGAKDDTVSLKVPAYTTARSRTLRSGTPLVKDALTETKVDVVLDNHIYKLIGISDEELTLDITDFGAQVTGPAAGAVVREIDDDIGGELAGLDPEVSIALDEADPYLGLVDARIALNNHNVPASQRFLAVGSNVEAAILKSDRLSKFDQAGSSEPMRENVIGRIAGFTAVTANSLDPDLAVAAHKTALAMVLVTPSNPQGAVFSESRNFQGFNLRVLRDYDPTGADGPEDRLLVDSFMGTGVVKDRGTLDADGKFQPSVDGTDAPILVRAVHCWIGGS